jgi:hypothetical protein
MPLTPGQCVDARLNQTIDILATGGNIINGFANPQASVIDRVRQTLYGRSGATYELLTAATVPPLSQQKFFDLLNLHNKIVEFGGGTPLSFDGTWNINALATPGEAVAFANSPLGHLLSYTNFMSGAGPVYFPLTDLQRYLEPGIPGAVLLGELTFAGVLGFAMGGRQVDRTLCSVSNPVDPNDPCKNINKIFGVLMDAFGSVLDNIAVGLGLMNDLLNQAAAYLDQVTSFLAGLILKLEEAIGTLLATVLGALRYGVAAFLETLGLDPCLRVVLGAIATPTLNNAITNLVNNPIV